jgi:hypothetical protein
MSDKTRYRSQKNTSLYITAIYNGYIEDQEMSDKTRYRSQKNTPLYDITAI